MSGQHVPLWLLPGGALYRTKNRFRARTIDFGVSLGRSSLEIFGGTPS
jgi:hypothetical protein